MQELLQLIVPSRVSHDVRIEVRAWNFRILIGPMTNDKIITELEDFVLKICSFQVLFHAINLPNIFNELMFQSVN